MTEHEHDLDLIAEYAGGADLPGAADLVAACAVCRAEFEAQQRVAHWLAAAPAAAMTAEERAALREAVRPGAKARAGLLGWTYRIATVAASVAAVALVVNVANPAARQASLSETAAPSSPDNRYDAETVGGLGAATTLAAPATTAAVAAPEMTTMMEAADMDELKVEVDQLVERARQAGQEASATPDAGETACLQQVGDRVVLVSATGKLGERAVVVHVVQGEQPEAHVYDAETCDEVDLGAPEG